MIFDKSGQRPQTILEEVFNAILHGVGAALSIAGLVLLVVFAAIQGDPWKVVSFAIYGATLILLFMSSTMHHSLRPKTAKYVFLVFDHLSIYLLIAGTYTPFALVSLRGPWGWTLFGIVWGIALGGVIFKSLTTGKYEAISLAMYGVMGWLVVLVLHKVVAALGTGGVLLLALGGGLYSFGIIFYIFDRVYLLHTLWHLFVLGGAIAHWFCMWFYVLPK